MDTFRMDGYRPWLERAIRVDSDNDWSMHTIDYAGFKRKLRFFSKRRSQLRGMLANSRDDSILASDLDDVMGPPPQLPHGTLDQGTDFLFATPRATGKTTAELMSALTGAASSLSTKVQETSQVQYVAFSDDDEIELMDQRRAGGRPPVPLQIETDTSNRSERSSIFWGPPRVKRQAVLRQVSNFERNDMMIFLAMELDKVVMFYLSQWQAISTQILDYQSTVTDLQQRQLGNVSTRMADPLLQQIGTELLELEAFVVINLVTVRQMLIRYDAFVRTLEGTPMLEYYMKFMMNPGIRFFHSDSKDGALTKSFRKLLQHAELEALSEKFVDICSVGRNSELIEKFQRQRMEFAYVLESSERVQAVVSSGHTGSIQDTFLHTLRHYFLLGMMEDRLGYEPTYLISRGASLSREMQIMADWRKGNPRHDSQKDVFEDEPEETSSTMDYQKTFNLVMALLAAFLYCMNYYIVEPSSTMYVNALGGQDALAGALIGMMPMASFLAAIVYSIWTNYSFRQPFLLSCFLMLSGNLIYSYAYEYKSLTMAFLGRFMTGLGGPKCIVRRYMADTTSLSIRTSVNACFGMVVAAGSALGPGCAIMLSQLNFGVTLPKGYQISVNGMTGPGYLMALLWLLFSIALCLDFREPDRDGLEEQKRLELLQNKEDIAEDESRSSSSRVSPHRLESSDSLGSRGEPCGNDDLATLYSGTTSSYDADGWKSENIGADATCMDKFRRFSHLVTLPVRICLGLLFAKVFVIESLVSSTSTISKNRYQWQVYEVGILGCVNGFFVIPLSILVGRFSMTCQDRVLMMWLLTIGLIGVLLLIDVTDFTMTESSHYNEDQRFASGPRRYVLGYFTVYMSIQSFEGVIGSALSKLIPTALASGTLNSGLLATLVDTFGRTCGDLFISLCGFLNLRQLMNLLFVPGAIILTTCLFVVRKHYDSLAV